MCGEQERLDEKSMSAFSGWAGARHKNRTEQNAERVSPRRAARKERTIYLCVAVVQCNKFIFASRSLARASTTLDGD